MSILDPDGFGVDWVGLALFGVRIHVNPLQCLCLISTGSGEGIEDAASLIRKKLDNPGLEWRDVSKRCMN